MDLKKTFIIAEIAQAHDGSLGILHSYIDSLANTGVDAIKFQTHIAEAESSYAEPFRINFSYEDKSRFDYWKRVSFTEEQWIGIKEHCDRVGVEFMSSPFSIAAVNLLEKIGVKKYKIGSGEVSNLLLLERIAKTGKPIILSSGMSSYFELSNALELIKIYGNETVILQCTTSYPTPPERIGLNVLEELKKRFNTPVGLSDHSGSIYPSVAAVALGAEYLEFHAVFDKRMFGPDSSSSLTIDQISELVKAVRLIETAINNPLDKNNLEPYTDLKVIFGKALAVNKNLKKGHILTLDDLETKKPGNMGISAAEYASVVNRVLLNSKKKYDFLLQEDIQH